MTVSLYDESEKLEIFRKEMGNVRLASMSTREYRSTYPYPTTSEEETAVCLRIQRSHATVIALQSRLQWTCRIMSESSNAPFLKWCSVCASHRELHGVADTMIETMCCMTQKEQLEKHTVDLLKNKVW
jgi:hypothetical protein